MSTILTSVGSFVTAAMGWVGDVVDVVEAEPILLLFVAGVPLVGLGAGLLSRLIHVRG